MKKNQVGKSFTAQQNQMWPELGSFSAIQKSRNCKFNFLRNTKMERRKMLSQLTLKRIQRCESVIFLGKIWNVYFVDFFTFWNVFFVFSCSFCLLLIWRVWVWDGLDWMCLGWNGYRCLCFSPTQENQSGTDKKEREIQYLTFN